MGLRAELLALIEDSDIDLQRDFDDHTSIIKSGLFDSNALFSLVIWIQEQIGSEMDFTQFDIAEKWDTVENILAFINEQKVGQNN